MSAFLNTTRLLSVPIEAGAMTPEAELLVTFLPVDNTQAGARHLFSGNGRISFHALVNLSKQDTQENTQRIFAVGLEGDL